MSKSAMPEELKKLIDDFLKEIDDGGPAVGIAAAAFVYDHMAKRDEKLKVAYKAKCDIVRVLMKDQGALVKENAFLRMEYGQLRAELELAIGALEKINREELNSQRPGGGHSRSATISYEALDKLRA